MSSKLALIKNYNSLEDNNIIVESRNMSIEEQASFVILPKEVKENDKYIIPFEIKEAFLNRILFMYLIFFGFSFLPESIVVFTNRRYDYRTIFYTIKYALLGLVLLFISIATIAIIIRDFLIKKGSVLVYFLTILQFINYLLIICFLSFYDVNIAIAFSSVITIGIVITYFLNLYKLTASKNWIKMTIIFLVMFIILVVYIVCVNSHYVEFFILLVFLIQFFTYINVEQHYLLYEYVNKYNYNANNLPIRLYFTTVLLLPGEIVICCFK